MLWGPKLEAHLTGLPQYADMLLDQQHGQLMKPRVALGSIRVNKPPRRGIIATTVEIVKESSAGSRSSSIDTKDNVHVPSYNAASSGQFTHCTLCLANDHNMEDCTFTSKELATVCEENFQTRNSIRRRIPGARDRGDIRYSESLRIPR